MLRIFEDALAATSPEETVVRARLKDMALFSREATTALDALLKGWRPRGGKGLD